MSTEKQSESLRKRFHDEFCHYPDSHLETSGLDCSLSEETAYPNLILSFIRTFASSLLDEVKLEEKPGEFDVDDFSRISARSYNQAIRDFTTKVEEVKTRHGL
ncbi:MAG TPA: hypothetical protein VJ464_13480 [Blastocatellia bacterium]|nr:hypothetical protein [Blastocatellia bacterium]